MDLKMKTRVMNIHCACEGCKRKVKTCVLYSDAQGGTVKVSGNFGTHNRTKKLDKSVKCSEIEEAPKISHSVKSAPQYERSRSGTSRAGGSHKSSNSVKSGGEAQSQKGSKAPSVASMENKSVKKLDLTDLESKRSGKSRVSQNGGGKSGGKGGLFGFGKFFGSGGENKKSRSGKGVESVHGGSMHGSEATHSVAGSSRGGSKRGPTSHHSGERRSQMGDPYNQQHLQMTAAMHHQTGAYYDGPNRPMSPPKHRESYVHYFSDENANACNIM